MPIPRKWLVAILRCSGFLRLWRFTQRRRITILTVHSVVNPNKSSQWTPLRASVSPQCLEDHLRVLGRYYRFISLSTAVEMITGRLPVQPNCLVLTFDDGYRNNLTHALPVLRRLGIRATVFLSTGNVDQRRSFCFDRLDFALQALNVDGREVRIGPETERIHGGDRATLRASYARLRTRAKSIPSDAAMLAQLDGIAATMEAESGRALANIFEGDEWSAVVTWPEVQAATGELDFGSHTVDHVRLACVGDETAREQLLNSKRAIESHTGRPCDHLSYPNGSFNAHVARLARDCGYVCGLTTVEGNNRIGDDPMALRRIGLPGGSSVAELLVRVSALSAAISTCKQRLLAAWRRRRSGSGETP